MITSPPEPEGEVDIERMFHELEEEAEQVRASREMYRDESRAKDFKIARLLTEIERLERENKRLRWLMTIAQAAR